MLVSPSWAGVVTPSEALWSEVTPQPLLPGLPPLPPTGPAFPYLAKSQAPGPDPSWAWAGGSSAPPLVTPARLVPRVLPGPAQAAPLPARACCQRQPGFSGLLPHSRCGGCPSGLLLGHATRLGGQLQPLDGSTAPVGARGLRLVGQAGRPAWSVSEGAGAQSGLLGSLFWENRPPSTAPASSLLPASQLAQGWGY